MKVQLPGKVIWFLPALCFMLMIAGCATPRDGTQPAATAIQRLKGASWCYQGYTFAVFDRDSYCLLIVREDATGRRASKPIARLNYDGLKFSFLMYEAASDLARQHWEFRPSQKLYDNLAMEMNTMAAQLKEAMNFP